MRTTYHENSFSSYRYAGLVPTKYNVCRGDNNNMNSMKGVGFFILLQYVVTMKRSQYTTTQISFPPSKESNHNTKGSGELELIDFSRQLAVALLQLDRVRIFRMCSMMRGSHLTCSSPP